MSLRRRSRSETSRIIEAMLAAGTFTARGLAEATGAKYHTVRTVMGRCGEYLVVEGREPAVGPGKPAYRYRLSDRARAELEGVRAEVDAADVVESLEVPASLLVAHDGLHFDDPDTDQAPSEVLQEAREELAYADRLLADSDLSPTATAALRKQLRLTRFLTELTRIEIEGEPAPNERLPWLTDFADTPEGRLLGRCVRSPYSAWLFNRIDKLHSMPAVGSSEPYQAGAVLAEPDRLLMDHHASLLEDRVFNPPAAALAG